MGVIISTASGHKRQPLRNHAEESTQLIWYEEEFQIVTEVKVPGLTPLIEVFHFLEMFKLQEAGEKHFSVLCD